MPAENPQTLKDRARRMPSGPESHDHCHMRTGVSSLRKHRLKLLVVAICSSGSIEATLPPTTSTATRTTRTTSTTTRPARGQQVTTTTPQDQQRQTRYHPESTRETTSCKTPAGDPGNQQETPAGQHQETPKNSAEMLSPQVLVHWNDMLSMLSPKVLVHWTDHAGTGRDCLP